MDFSNLVAVVTGGSHGIGRATVEKLIAAGATVVVLDLEPAEHGQFVPTDVAEPESVREAIAGVLERHGRLDLAVNCAGITGPPGRLWELDLADYERVMGVNTRGVFLCLKHQLPPMLAQGRGSIVNVASMASMAAAHGLAAYCASKHAVLGLTRTAALECARQGVRVNAVCPAVVDTRMTQSFAEHRDMEKLSKLHPLGRLARPEEVADAILWLLSDQSSFVTGTGLMVDGGFLLA